MIFVGNRIATVKGNIMINIINFLNFGQLLILLFIELYKERQWYALLYKLESDPALVFVLVPSLAI